MIMFGHNDAENHDSSKTIKKNTATSCLQSRFHQNNSCGKRRISAHHPVTPARPEQRDRGAEPNGADRSRFVEMNGGQMGQGQRVQCGHNCGFVFRAVELQQSGERRLTLCSSCFMNRTCSQIQINSTLPEFNDSLQLANAIVV